MKERTITTPVDLVKASADLAGYAQYLPFVITITSGKKIRGDGANARYWAMLQESIDLISEEIKEYAEKEGYTPLVARKIIAADLPWEQSLILACRKKEPVHEVIKMIMDIPTSTRLGTKEFAVFNDKIDMTMAEIVGNIRAICRKVP